MAKKEDQKDAQVPVNVVAKMEAAEPIPVPAVPDVAERVTGPPMDSALDRWVPKTRLGRSVFEGKITDINEILSSGERIIEPEIVDKLLPGIKNELILIGGRVGKGGSIQRIPVRITAAMHKSGRRFHTSALVIVGNEDGIIGVGQGRATETREAIRKGVEKAKMDIVRIKRGCGSWECGCGTEHSVPYKISGKCGTVRVELLPAPRGVGLVAQNEAKKVLKLAGIKDVWMRSFGNTGMRINLVNALYAALKKLYTYDRGLA